MKYQEFIAQKTKAAKPKGIKPKNLNKHLFDFQAHVVEMALRNSRYANFGGCGTGKSLMELAWADQIIRATNKPILLLTPLAVAGQMIEEGEKFGIEVSRTFGKAKIHVLNYEQIHNIDTSAYVGVIADESSLLKSIDGKTRQLLIDLFARTEFKFPNTATPSPNDPMELGNHAEFLNVMSRNEMLSMYFVHDGGETAKWRIKKHGVMPFYQWVSTWAMMYESPSDLGYDGSKFVLPPLTVKEEKIQTENRSNSLFNDIAVSATKFNAELRATIRERLTRAVEVAEAKDEPFIIWVKQDVEADYVKELLPEAVEVRGSQSIQEKEEKLLGFAHGQFRVLLTKPKIAQYGLNYQNCNNQVFPSLDYSFESTYQAIRRSYRFGQKKEVTVTIISTDTMQNVLASIKAKQLQFTEMISQMRIARNGIQSN